MTSSNQNSYAILFVDDEEKARKMFTRLVSSQFNVLTAADVNEAKHILAQQHAHIGVLITDQRMPGEFGVELLRYVRQTYPKIIRVLTTAYSDLEDAIAAVNTGEIFRYINKPWNADELLIDLRLAMNFFELEQDRLQLIQEKMSLSHRQSKMELMKAMISMTAAQTGYQRPRLAMQSFLEQIATPQVIAESTTANTDTTAGYWEKELAKIEKLIRINQSLNQWTATYGSLLDQPATNPIDYTSCIAQISQQLPISVDSSACETPALPQTILNETGLLAILQVVTDVMAYTEQGYKDITLRCTQQEQALFISVVPASQPTHTHWLANYLFTPGEPVIEEKTGQLLGVFAAVYHLGGQIMLVFDQDRLLEIQLLIPQSENKHERTDLEGGVWIEDLFVLFN